MDAAKAIKVAHPRTPTVLMRLSFLRQTLKTQFLGVNRSAKREKVTVTRFSIISKLMEVVWSLNSNLRYTRILAWTGFEPGTKNSLFAMQPLGYEGKHASYGLDEGMESKGS